MYKLTALEMVNDCNIPLNGDMASAVADELESLMFSDPIARISSRGHYQYVSAGQDGDVVFACLVYAGNSRPTTVAINVSLSEFRRARSTYAILDMAFHVQADVARAADAIASLR
jgi:hypothetical protein